MSRCRHRFATWCPRFKNKGSWICSAQTLCRSWRGTARGDTVSNHGHGLPPTRRAPWPNGPGEFRRNARGVAHAKIGQSRKVRGSNSCGERATFRVSDRRRLLPAAAPYLLAHGSAAWAPSAVLAQEETTLPEVRVIATTPAPAGPRRPARTAPAPTRGTQQTPAQTAAPPAPSEPGVIDRDKSRPPPRR